MTFDATGVTHRANWGTITHSTSSTGSATFSVTVSNGAGATIAYQWQTRTGNNSFTDIADADDRILTVTGLTSSDNGRQYRCKITRTGGSDQASGVTDTHYSNTASVSIS